MDIPFLLSGFFSGILLIGLVKKFYQPFFTLSEASLKILNSLLLPESDDGKIKSVEKNLGKLLKALAVFFSWILLILALSAIPAFIYSFIFEVSPFNLKLDSWDYIVSLSLGSIIPFISLKKKDQLSYSPVSKLFHRLVLDNYQFGKKLFSYELKKYGKENKLKNDFVVVSGLARAGTTALMLKFNEVNNLKSLDYSNMPLLMAPNLWKKIYSPKEGKKKERAHGDGIQVGLNSAEALEEYFFKLQLEDSYISKKGLDLHGVSPDVYEQYIKYQSLILKEEGDTYLAKNNNLLLRYASLRSQNPHFKVIFLFRNPLDHAYSLLSQHRRYLETQEEDPFVLEYMNWLGHHEFGLGQKPFLFPNQRAVTGDKNSLDFWLLLWANYYGYLLNFLEDENLFLVHYSDFCDSPNEMLNQIMDGIGIDYVYEGIDPFPNQKKIKEGFSEELLEACMASYKGLLEKKMKF